MSDAPLAVIFDLDGTLVDSAPDMHAAIARVLEARGLAPLPPERIRSFVGHGVGVLVDRVIGAAGGDPADAAAFQRDYLAAYQAGLHIDTVEYDGVRAALDTLGTAGHPLAVCTNKPQGMAEGLLASMGMADLFRTVIGGDTDFGRKPDPAPLREVMRRLGTDRAVMVGDSPADAGAARAAGIPILLYTGGYRDQSVEQIAPDAAFDHWSELPDLIARLG